MSRRIKLALALGASLLLVFSCRGIGDEPKSKEKLAKKYLELVRTLVSPNEKPATLNHGGKGHVDFPVGYDVKAQDRIKIARQALNDNFEEAFRSSLNRWTITVTA